MIRALHLLTVLLFSIQSVFAQEGPVTLDQVPGELQEISEDEPLAKTFSPEAAARYLDEASLTWQKKKKCATCHTNMSYMMARPALGNVLEDSGEVRAFFEDYRKVRWAKKGPGENQGFWPIVVATGLVFNDLQTTGELSEISRDVLNFLWTSQREDGSWRWPDCDYAPLEIDDHFGVTLAALTVGIAPNDYANTPAAREGIRKLTDYLKTDPPKSLHHRAMLAWSSLRIEGIATEAQREKTLAELLALQLPDGGWSTSGFLTDWNGLTAEEDEPLKTEISDGYGTALVIIIARELGIPAEDPRIRNGITWIKANQREGGKWFTRSPVAYANNLISNIGTSYVILALQACDELPGAPESPLGK
ncbi:MAG: terpene cyclase/mutase family protein [Verrucomicrobiales bacterium]|nr:terpene cyclase/mutase family protein [Verrucomicrobiales bacterium]